MSVEKTKYGTWQSRWRDANGRQRARTFKRKIEADRHQRAILADLHRGVHVDTADRITVAEWADVWLEGARNLGQGGIDTYRRSLGYILPVLGHLPLVRLDDRAIDAFLADELERGLAPSTVHRHYRTLHRMCAVAVERRRLASNPCGPVVPPRVEHTEMRFLTVEQVDALADAITDRYRWWVHTAVYAGLRWSETVGLRRASIGGGRLVVVEQLVRRDDGQWHRDRPKTRAGRRSIVLPGFLAAGLAEHLEEWSSEGADGLVFPNRNGSPMIGSSFTGNVFKPALRRAGLDEGVRIHDLRHTAVALAIKAGAHPKAIQTRMGHASITVTLDRYGHLFPDIDADLAVALDGLRSCT